MRILYRRRTCRLCGDFRQDHLRRQMTGIGNRIGRLPATSRISLTRVNCSKAMGHAPTVNGIDVPMELLVTT